MLRHDLQPRPRELVAHQHRDHAAEEKEHAGVGGNAQADPLVVGRPDPLEQAAAHSACHRRISRAHDAHDEVHVGVAQAAELGAVSEQLSLVVEHEVERRRPAGNASRLKRTSGPRTSGSRSLDVSVKRIVVSTGNDEHGKPVARPEHVLPVRVVEAPLPLERGDRDAKARVRAHRVDAALGAERRGDEQRRDQREADRVQRLRELGLVLALRERPVAGAAAGADDGRNRRRRRRRGRRGSSPRDRARRGPRTRAECRPPGDDYPRPSRLHARRQEARGGCLERRDDRQPDASPSRSTDAAVTSAASGPTRTRTRLPTGTREAIGARRWFRRSRRAPRARGRRPTDRRAARPRRAPDRWRSRRRRGEGDLRQPAGSCSATPSTTLPPASSATNASFGAATRSAGVASCRNRPGRAPRRDRRGSRRPRSRA